MLTIGARGQIFLVAGVTDMRKAFNTLAAVVRNQLHRDPLLCGVPRYVAGGARGPPPPARSRD
jgi:transposase